MDGWNQYALGACARSADGTLEGVGVARFARAAADSNVAEIAITVVDAYQGRGIGSILARELAADARASGIKELVATVCGDNRPSVSLLKSIAKSLQVSRSGPERTFVIGLEA